MVELTKDQCESFIDLIELNLFEIIRNDPDFDDLGWLVNVVDAYKLMKAAVEKEKAK